MSPAPASGTGAPDGAPGSSTERSHPADAGDLAAPRALGLRLRAELAGWPLPLLAVETTYSLLRGTATPAAWAAAVGALRGEDQAGPWVALADRDDLLGLPTALRAFGRARLGIGATVALPPLQLGDEPAIALLLAPDATAYASLCRFLSWRHEDADGWHAWACGGRPAVAIDGLVVAVADAGWALRLSDLGLEVHWRWELRPRPVPDAVAARGIVPVAAPILTHLDATGQGIEPVLQAVRTADVVERTRRLAAGAALADLVQARRAYAGHEDALERGTALLARCRYLPGGTAAEPIFHMPPSHWAQPDIELRRLALEGLIARYGVRAPKAVYDRLDHELAVIHTKRFAGYLLTVYDLAHGRRTCGRGSGASSLVVYCLGITNVDPIKYNLLFERFLAPERTDPPDLDVDFPWDERDLVIQAALTRYGAEHAAMVSTHQALSRWAALRDAARAFGYDDAAITAMRQQLVESARYGTQSDLPDPWPAIIAAARTLAGSPRHLSLHCGGMVITELPLRDLVPVHLAAKTIDGQNVPAISWEKDGAEELGLVKIDLLGNRSLAVVRDCLADLAEDGWVSNEAQWKPEEDPRTKELVATGATFGCFYIESPAMRQLQAKVGDGSFDRLVVHSSIIRPAAARWIAAYIKRHHHVRETGTHLDEWYPHPALRGLLSESYGVLSYQEDVMLVCQRLARFGSREANQIRKALGKWDAPERLRGLAPAFFAGCEANAVTSAVAGVVWDMISSFAGYSFCKAHSASFAMVSFQCAYLKAHYPAHFLARVIANQGGFYGTSAYVEEARRLGIEIRGPCVQASIYLTRREGAGAIRIGLHLIPGLTHAAALTILSARVQQPFDSATDLMQRCHLHAADLQRLHDAGALDELLARYTPSQRSWVVAAVGRRGPGTITAHGQQAIGLTVDGCAADPMPPALPPVPLRDLHRQRCSTLGFFPQAHPLTLWDLPVRRWRCRDLGPHLRGRQVTLIGLNITRKQVTAHTRTDDDGQPLAQPIEEPMAFVTLEDETGLAETVWFPAAYRTYGVVLERPAPIRCSGRIEVEFGLVTITVERAESLTP
jgi:DNA polymerase-3 subunit alpha/error-prone DNA polymerase